MACSSDGRRVAASLSGSASPTHCHRERGIKDGCARGGNKVNGYGEERGRLTGASGARAI